MNARRAWIGACEVKVQQIRHSSMPIPEEMVKKHETD